MIHSHLVRQCNYWKVTPVREQEVCSNKVLSTIVESHRHGMEACQHETVYRQRTAELISTASLIKIAVIPFQTQVQVKYQ